MYVAPRKNAAVTQRRPDRLMAELDKFEQRLQQWLAISEDNACWFRRDPFTAMRAAGLDMDDELMCELERIMSGIGKKLK
ncbi:MAG TPA: hypothetical protein VHN74_04925 [Candidatus Angelobacter sp.]|jgi:hypothetical protein|nr:hypothetical protein [Candidatus Angelobacter sp.]